MYDVGGKLLESIKGYVNSLACVKTVEGESNCCRINSGV